MSEWQLFKPGTIPECTTPEWYLDRPRAPHLEEGSHRGRLDIAADFVRIAAIDYGITSVVDLGSGDGGLLSLLRDMTELAAHTAMWGYDLQHSNVDPAVTERGVDVRYGDVVNGDVEWGDLAVCTEMLEHLVDPHAFVRRIAEESKFIVASSPFTETNESHYAFHTWAWDQAGYRALMEHAGFEVIRHETWYMFQIILGRTL